MSGHAKYAPSAASRWLRCAGSVPLITSLNAVDSGSRYAAEGTAAHQLAEWCLTQEKDAKHFIGKEIVVPGADVLEEFRFTVDQAMAGYVQQYLVAIRSRAADSLEIEARIDLSGVLDLPEQGGTTDVVIVCGDRLEIHDLKYGQGVQVFAEENEQLMLYAAGKLDELDMLGTDIAQVDLWIHQPRLDHVDVWTATADQVRAFGNAAKAAVARIEAMTPADATLNLTPGEKQCQWCPMKARCTALANFVADTVFENLDEQTTKPVPDDLTALGEYRKRVNLIESWCAAVCAETQAKLAEGHQVPGWKLVEGRRGNRAWKDEAEVATVMSKSFRLKKDQMYNMKLISPAQAEKVVTPQRWEKLAEMVTQPPGKPQVAPESDKRPAIDPASMFEDNSNPADLE